MRLASARKGRFAKRSLFSKLVHRFRHCLSHRPAMKLLQASLVTLMLLGCRSETPSPPGAVDPLPEMDTDEFMIVDFDDPESIEQWESSFFNFRQSKLVVVELKFVHGFMRDTSGDPARVAIHVEEAVKEGVAPEQQAAIDDFVQNEEVIHGRIRDAVYQYYQEVYPAIKESLSKGWGDDLDDILPKVVIGNELDGLVQFDTISVHPPVQGTATMGLGFVVPWDVEPTMAMGLRLRDGEVESIGAWYEASHRESQP